MYHPKLSALVLALSVSLRCIISAPSNRYYASSEQSDLRTDGWMPSGFSSNPFLGVMEALPREGLTEVNRHHLEKRRCNTATCVTQRLADFLIRSSNTIGTVYAPTNVGSSTYGKRELQGRVSGQHL